MLTPARYKGIHGGRGSGKSHFFGQMAVATNFSEPRRGVCIREVQNSIKDSVKQLIEDKIDDLGLGGWFRVTRDEITGANGSQIVFKGMQSYNADNIKSLEGFDWAWVEEAQNLSKRSLELLRPTIRKPGSELWFGWNPRHDTDPVDDLLRGPHRPTDAKVIELNWRDNPFFPQVLRDEMERDFRADPELAEHIWNGGYEIISEAAYYARHVAAVEREGRIGKFPYDPAKRLRTAWDLGMDDYTAIWFIQDDSTHATVVDFWEGNGLGLDEIVSLALPEVFIPPPGEFQFEGWRQVKALEALAREQPFKYTEHFLPHDVKVRELGASGRHRHQTLELLGMRNLRKGVPADPETRVAALRSLFPQMRFNDTPRVRHGLKRLRHYKRKMNELLGQYMGPLKDGNDHAADAAGEYAINCGLMPVEMPKAPSKPDRLVLTTNDDGTINVPMTVAEMIAMQRRITEERPWM